MKRRSLSPETGAALSIPMRLAGAHKDSSFVTHLLGKTLYRSKVLSGLVQAVQKRGFKNVVLVDPKQAFG